MLNKEKTCANIPKVAFVPRKLYKYSLLVFTRENFFWCQGLKFQFRCFKNKVRENGISGSQWLCKRKKNTYFCRLLLLALAAFLRALLQTI